MTVEQQFYVDFVSYMFGCFGSSVEERPNNHQQGLPKQIKMAISWTTMFLKVDTWKCTLFAPFMLPERYSGISLPFQISYSIMKSRGGSRAAETSKMERFVIIVNGFQPLTIITKRSILDVAAVLDPPLKSLQ